MYPRIGLPTKPAHVGTHVCCLLRDRRKAASFVSCMRRQARASLGKPLISHLRYASQVLQISSQYFNPGNSRAFSSPGSTNYNMSRRCGSSKPTSIPLNGEASKPERYEKQKERNEGLTVRHRKKPSTKVISAAGGGRGNVYGKAKSEYLNENKNNTAGAKNRLNPAHNSRNVSCATNKLSDYPDQPRH